MGLPAKIARYVNTIIEIEQQLSHKNRTTKTTRKKDYKNYIEPKNQAIYQ